MIAYLTPAAAIISWPNVDNHAIIVDDESTISYCQVVSDTETVSVDPADVSSAIISYTITFQCRVPNTAPRPEFWKWIIRRHTQTASLRAKSYARKGWHRSRGQLWRKPSINVAPTIVPLILVFIVIL